MTTHAQEGEHIEDGGATPAAAVSTAGLIHSAIEDASRLVTGEIQLAKQEISESLHAAVMALVAGAAAVFAVIAFLIMGIVTLVVAVPLHWVAALACAGVFLVIAVMGGVLAMGRLKRISPLRQTVQTLKEDVAWAKQQLTPEKR
jgi:uncharacterized membrane protein YqjE